jgi:hypothetical protein
VLLLRVPSSSSPAKGLYNPKAFFTHAASLDQAFAHCPRFPTAASRRSLGRVSVPVWLTILSDQLPIAALVGRYPANKLIGRGPIQRRPCGLCPASRPGTCGISRGFPRLSPTFGQVPTRYSPVRRWTPPEGDAPLDLHVLSAPPAFVLSQDQTLSFRSEPRTHPIPPEISPRRQRTGPPAHYPPRVVRPQATDQSPRRSPAGHKGQTMRETNDPMPTQGQRPPPAHPFPLSRCQRAAAPPERATRHRGAGGASGYIATPLPARKPLSPFDPGLTLW